MRVSLNGYGDSIPEAVFGADLFESPLEPDTALKLFLEDGDSFDKSVYEDLGYTHYEVWCVGAAGGRGGRSANFNWRVCGGGAAGGGGLHRIAGALADLPDSVPITVGQAGVNGRDSNDVPPYQGKLNSSSQFDYVLDEDGFAIDLDILVNPSYVSPLDGDDGEASSFGSICRASGGKGGKAANLILIEPYPLWGGAFGGGYGGLFWSFYFVPGDGGEGGAGDRDVAGGGGDKGDVTHTEQIVTYGPETTMVTAGGGSVPRLTTHSTPSSTEYALARDGTWDGRIGKGGGGGYGGSYQAFPIPKRAGDGGRGSYSYRDTSVFGSREKAHAVDSFVANGEAILAGSGGGARVNKLSRYGSRVPGADPNGAVFIRLITIVDE